MKKSPIVATLLATICLIAACTRNSNDNNGEVIVDPPTHIDSSGCVLTNVTYSYANHLPYYTDPIVLTYDAQGRVTKRSNGSSFLAAYTYESGQIIKRTYVNTIVVVDSLLVGKEVFTLDADSRITASNEAWYNNPKSEEDYSRKDSTIYTYDDAGYLIFKKVLAYGKYLSEEFNFTYADSNLVQKEHIYYNYWSSSQSTKYGADTIQYTYDKTALYPEAKYLYEVGPAQVASELKLGKANKNNVTQIVLKMYDGTETRSQNLFKTIAFTYSLTGPKPGVVSVKSTTTQGYEVSNEIKFGYNCDNATK